MSTETLVPAVEMAGAQNSSDISAEPVLQEIPSGENIAEAVRNAIKILGITAGAIVIPGGFIIAGAAGAVWLTKKMRSPQNGTEGR